MMSRGIARSPQEVVAQLTRLDSIRFLSLSVTTKSAAHAVHARVKERIQAVDAKLGKVSPVLIDTFARGHNYLRISLTERCNLRCTYCMPETGIPSSSLTPASHLLNTPEIIRISHLFVSQGVQKIRLTGGEPTIRKDLLSIVSQLNELRDIGLNEIGITSNGIALERKLEQLVANGLTRLNLSLDTLQPLKFEQITRRRGLAAVLSCLDSALSHLDTDSAHNSWKPGLRSVKLNVVVTREGNLDEVPDLVALTKTLPISVRFIELMPFDGNNFTRNSMVPSRELLHQLREIHGEAVVPCNHSDENGSSETAQYYKVQGWKGKFGFISSMSDMFCATCNRLRVTADGSLKVCLFDGSEVSLRDALRGGASEEEILDTIRMAVHGKKASHGGLKLLAENVGKNREMVRIGLMDNPRPVRPASRAGLLAKRRIPDSLAQIHSILATGKQSQMRLSSSLARDLTHIDPSTGRPSMVDVSSKPDTTRVAVAHGFIRLNAVAYSLLDPLSSLDGVDETSIEYQKALKKCKSATNVLVTAQIAGTMAAKSTSGLIPLCHPLSLSHVSLQLDPTKEVNVLGVVCRATVKCKGSTGVEMEALTAVSIALLTVWDMVKAVAGKEMVIENLHVVQKSGGMSGDWHRAKS